MNTEPTLHQAIIKNDLKAVKELAKQTDEVNAVNEWGFTALELAQFLGKKACVELLQLPVPRRIYVLRRGTTKAKQLSEIEFQNFFFLEYRSHLTFSNYVSFKETLKNCPWVIAKSCLGKENRKAGIQYHHEISSGYVADVSIRWINDDLGYGLFAESDLPSNTYIGEFTGSVRRLYRTHPNQNAYCFHYPTRFWSFNYTIIDASRGGNETRFINHSDFPNLQPICAYDRDLLHIVFVTNAAIKSGTQLTYNYGSDYWLRRKKVCI